MGFDENKVSRNAHFDRRISYAQVRDKVEDPSWVSRHGFLPLISKMIVEKKFNGSEVKVKERAIAYASHVDKCIYHYYASMLNARYNEIACEHGINNAAIAYRTNLGKCNIHFALGAFAKMAEMGSCYVLVADFKSFFPSLSHAIAKRQLRKVFVDGSIPDDYYNVFKSVIHWTQWDEDKLMLANGIKPLSKYAQKRFNCLSLALPRKKFKSMAASEVERPWLETGKGFPQGVSICGVLSNIFMMDFDEALTRFVTGRNGMYMRYCDDVIMILPDKSAFRESCSLMFELAEEHELVIEEHKTSCFKVDDRRVFKSYLHGEVAKDEASAKIQYLGFDFDGEEVRLRQRTIGRYYRKMRRRIAFVFNQEQRPSKKWIAGIYTDYSRKGLADNATHFLTYAYRADKVCTKLPLQNGILKDVKRSYLKIKRSIQRFS